MCPFSCFNDLKKKELVLMHARRPGPLGEEDVPRSLAWGPSQPASPQRTDKGACTHQGWSFSRSDDSFRLTKDSGQGSEESGWLIHPMTSLCRERGGRGVTLQIPEALQGDAGSVPVALTVAQAGAASRRARQIG